MDRPEKYLYYLNMEIDDDYEGLIRTVSRSFSYHLSGCGSQSIKINGLGLRERMKPCWNKRKQGNGDFLLLYFYDPVMIKINGCEPVEAQKEWIIITPGTAHSYGNSHNAWNHSWMHFDGSMVSAMVSSNSIPTNRLMKAEDPYLVEQLLHRLNEEIYFFARPDFDIIALELSIFFKKVRRQAAMPGASAKIPENVIRTKRMIDFHYASIGSLGEISESIGYSPQYLSKNFKSYYRTSPIEYLIDKRMQVARQLLVETSLSIQEISDKVGYADFYYFSKLFKKRSGSSPSEYRKKNRL